MIRKIKYYLQIIPISKYITNWYEVVLLYILPKNEKVLNLKDKTKFVVRHYLDALTVKEIYAEDEYKISNKKPKTIIDIGTNLGTFTVLASKKHSKAKIYSFEPDINTYKLLSINLILNDCTNVSAFNLAIGGKKSKRDFYSHEASGLSSFNKTRVGMKKRSVEVITVGDFMKQNKIDICDFMKIDCEGAEYEIIKSIPVSLAVKIRSLAIEYHDSITKYNHTDLEKMLRERGYKDVVVAPHPLENDIGVIYASR